MRWARSLMILLAVFAAGSSAADVGWQEAVARLAEERSRAETCVALLKKYGDVDAIIRGALAYGEAKAEYDGIVTGLEVALAESNRPESLPDLEARLQGAFDKRAAFCKSVQPFLSPSSVGTKGVAEELVSGKAAPLVEALKSIWTRRRDDNTLVRNTIRVQLEATLWPSYASVSPAP